MRNSNESFLTPNILRTLRTTRPYAKAEIYGSDKFPDIIGNVWFYKFTKGTIVVTELSGLPDNDKKTCDGKIYAMHIHEGGECSGNKNDPFANSGMHYNPNNCAHPYHAGDLPPIFSVSGGAWEAVLTDRFNAEEIVGRTVVVHENADDFKSQPSGNSGAKIACGIIRKN